MPRKKQHQSGIPIQKAAKLTWITSGWIVRYPGQNGEVIRMQLTAQQYEDAFEEANSKLNHEPNTEWIIC
jgi:hypothetical protein